MDDQKLVLSICPLPLNPIRTGGGDVFHQARGFLSITSEVIKVHSRNLVTFPKI